LADRRAPQELPPRECSKIATISTFKIDAWRIYVFFEHIST
jgi:hypothetical protein